MELQDKRVMVAGLARSGIAAARLLCAHGAQVAVYDQREDMPEAREALEGLPVSWHLGEDPNALALSRDMVVISPGIPWSAPFLAAARKAKREVIGELELGYRMSSGKIVAITGTNGKTTTATLAGEMFTKAGKLTYVAGNIGTPLTSVAEATRPEDVVVAEVSSFQLESVKEFHPSVCAVLNVSEDHLDRHGTMAAYTRLKARIFENQRAGDHVVLNWDDPVVREMAKQAPSKAVYFSMTERPPSGAWVEDGQICFGTRGEGKALCSIGEVGIPGAHNLQNVLCAVAIAMVSQVPPPVIRLTLRTFAGVEHRLELVRELEGVRYVNDSKGTNVDSTVKGIQAMGRPTVLIAGGHDKKADFAPLAEAVLAGQVHDVVLVGQTAPQIEAALRRSGYERLHSAHTMKEAVDMARGLARSGGNVLLSPACASFGMYRDFEERGRDFKAIVGDLK